MREKVALALLAAGLTAGALAADDVLLTNGEMFEGVIAQREGDHVRIRLEFGELRLRAVSVERIDRSRTPLAEYINRRRALLSAGEGAEAWLDLARWARGRGLAHGYREALLEAATLDPHAEALGPGMRDLGYVFEEDLDRWIPYADHMRRGGWVRHRGEWMRPEQRAAESAESERSVEEALSRTVEILALAQLERETRETREVRETTRAAAPPYGYPVAYFAGWFAPPSAPSSGDGPPPESAAARPPALPRDLFRRQPGSLLPVGGVNSGARFRQPGSLLPAVSGHR